MSDRCFYMACLDLEGRSCLVVGAGRVALEKITGLLECGAAVTVVAPAAEPEVAGLPVAWHGRPYRTSDVDGRFLVVAATPSRAVNSAVFRDCEARSVLCNVVDTLHQCSVILPAVHRQGPIAVAVSTGGASPALAQRLRDRIAQLVGPEQAELAHRLRELRPWAKTNYATYQERRDFFRAVVEEALP